MAAQLARLISVQVREAAASAPGQDAFGLTS